MDSHLEAGVDEAELAALYQATKDENELLEFKNYELQFKIQELEQYQSKILAAETTCEENVILNNADETSNSKALQIAEAKRQVSYLLGVCLAARCFRQS